MSDLSDFAVSLIIIAVTIFLAVIVGFVREVVLMIAAKSKARRVDPIVMAWPTILPCQSWVGREIEATTPPRYILEAERVAALRWDILEMSPRAEEGNDE